MKPSQTTTSAHLVQEVAPLDVADEAEAARLQGRSGLAYEAVPLLRLLSDGQERDLGILDAHDLVREDRAHVRELEEVLGPGVGVRACVDEDRRAADRRQRDRDRRAVHVGQPADLEQARGQRRPGVPRRDDSVGGSVADCPARAEERALPLLPHRLRRLLVHRHDLVGMDDLEVTGERLQKRARPVEDGRDLRRRGLERAGDDLLGRPIAAHRVDGDPDRRGH